MPFTAVCNLRNRSRPWPVIVEAKDQRAESFYRHFDFQPFQQTPLRLFLPMGQIAKLFA
jgi:hypothetical protein